MTVPQASALEHGCCRVGWRKASCSVACLQTEEQSCTSYPASSASSWVHSASCLVRSVLEDSAWTYSKHSTPFISVKHCTERTFWSSFWSHVCSSTETFSLPPLGTHIHVSFYVQKKSAFKNILCTLHSYFKLEKKRNMKSNFSIGIIKLLLKSCL